MKISTYICTFAYCFLSLQHQSIKTINVAQERKTKTEVIGDTALDLGKLTFAGIVLAGIFDSSINKTVVMLCGLTFCILLITVGVYFLTKKPKEG